MKSRIKEDRKALEELYRRFNRRCFVQPDPLQFLYEYPDTLDREVAALVASSLAYGRVAQILKSVRLVLDILGPSPRAFLMGVSREALMKALSGFRHRFSPGDEVADMLWSARNILEDWGSLEACFSSRLSREHDSVLHALTWFVRAFRASGGRDGFLLANPEKGSACKRWHLFLRWMVRRDEVDPGGWNGVPASMLVVPLDTHMHRIGLRMGGTCRKQADAKTAMELTEMFRRIDGEDPIRYDFCLTRLGIRADADPEEFFDDCRGSGN